MPRNAAALIIGNEILTGKIEDTNTRALGRFLFELGITLRRVVVVPDEMDAIVGTLNDLRAAHDLVFTSGGVGPTHDDITIDAVARALGVEVIRSEEMAARIREHFGDRTTEEHLRMADMPAGSALLRSAKVAWPTVVAENVHILPGVPAIFESKLEGLRERLDEGARFWNHTIYTTCDEGSVAALLGSLSEAHPSVDIGSYPVFDEPDYRVRVTFDARDPDASRAAADALVAGIAPEEFVRRTES